MDRAKLETLAAENPALVDFYFGDGGERLYRLVTDALRGGRDLPDGIVGEDLLEAVSSRLIALSAALNDVDPFYRYELEIRAGLIQNEPIEAVMQTPSDAAFIEFQQVDEAHYRVMRVIPRRAAALILRPISTSIMLQVATDSSDQEAVEDFLHFGAPLAGIPGTVTSVTGPPGIRQPTGDGRFTVLALPTDGAALPDLELRLIGSEGQAIETLDVVDVQIARGIRGAGMWISARDRSGVLHVTLLLKGPDGQDEIRIEPQSIAGKTPGEVMAAMRFWAALARSAGLLLAVRGGPALTGPWDLAAVEPELGPQNLLTLVEALLEIQRHTIARVVVPDVQTAPVEELAGIRMVGQLLRGEQIEVTWSEVRMTLGTPENLPPPDRAEVVLLDTRPLTVTINGQPVELDMQRRVFYRSARLADPTSARNAQTGDEIHFVPATTNSAVLFAVPTPAGQALDT